MKDNSCFFKVVLSISLWVFCSINCLTILAQKDVDTHLNNLTSWNDLVFSMAVEEDGLLTLKGLRTAAMMHVAIHDALNAIDPRYRQFIPLQSALDADPEIATIQAAFEVVSSQYPDHIAELRGMLHKGLVRANDKAAMTTGITLGKQAASAILQDREGDEWNGEAQYTWHPMAPGVYAEFNDHSGTPEGFIFGAGWAKAKPFMLTGQSQFRSPPPPEISSEAYTTAFNEVKEVGRTQSATRTPDQKHLAMWWKDFVENSHNRLLRDLVKNESIDVWTASRAFALMNMAIYDAYINVFDNKFHFNHWRPYTAIRWAEHDGNPDTRPDTSWNNLHLHTYAFPSYPSAHGTASAAAMRVLAETLGFGDDYAFDMRTVEVDRAGPFSGKVEMNPAVRSFESFSEAAMEASMSRLYLGIHFRYDSEEGYALGNKIGEYAANNFLQPLKEKK